MRSYELTAKNATDDQIAAMLRSELSKYDPARKPTWRCWQFWLGMAWGAAIIAAMDYGDVWICVGQCDAVMDAAHMEKGGSDGHH